MSPLPWPAPPPNIHHNLLGTWVKFLEKAAEPVDSTETYILTGSGGSTQHWTVYGFSTTIQLDGELPSNAPWDNGFQGDLFNNSIAYDVVGYILPGHSNVSVVVDVESALNSNGTSAWQGWHYNTSGVITDSQTRKISWKFYPNLSVIPD